MWLRLQRIERDAKYNVNGKVVSRRYYYVIAVHRWFKHTKYLRMLPGWFDNYTQGIPCEVQLTCYKYRVQRVLLDNILQYEITCALYH